jgi:branched-subunit amino acid transport protein AzlD
MHRFGLTWDQVNSVSSGTCLKTRLKCTGVHVPVRNVNSHCTKSQKNHTVRNWSKFATEFIIHLCLANTGGISCIILPAQVQSIWRIQYSRQFLHTYASIKPFDVRVQSICLSGSIYSSWKLVQVGVNKCCQVVVWCMHHAWFRNVITHVLVQTIIYDALNYSAPVSI